jgi:hypothetical protein
MLERIDNIDGAFAAHTDIRLSGAGGTLDITMPREQLPEIRVVRNQKMG